MNYKEIDKETMKKLHQVELEILKEFDRICKKNNLEYFAVGGTLIGSTKYESFIPWDDDVDIGMPRTDYDKFLSICDKEINDAYFVQSGNDYKTNWTTFTKIRKKNTLADERSTSHLDYPKGIFIDIFPYDNIFSDTGLKFKIRVNYVRVLMETLYYKWRVKKLNECHHKVLTIIFSIFSKKTLKKIINSQMIKDNDKDTLYMTSYCGAYDLSKETHLKETLLPTSSQKFEGMTIRTPHDTDKFLRRIYGNYHPDPPVEKRANHSMLAISFDLTKDK